MTVKTRAQAALVRAVKRGEIVRPKECSRCHRGYHLPIHGHHADYAKPYDVEWLCGSCHAHEHQGHAARRSDGTAFHHNVNIYIPPKVFEGLKRHGDAINKSRLATQAFKRRIRYLDNKLNERGEVKT